MDLDRVDVAVPGEVDSFFIPETAPAPVSPPSCFHVGATVVIHALARHTRFNGCVGQLIAFDVASSRWVVQLSDSFTCNVKPENICDAPGHTVHLSGHEAPTPPAAVTPPELLFGTGTPPPRSPSLSGIDGLPAHNSTSGPIESVPSITGTPQVEREPYPSDFKAMTKGAEGVVTWDALPDVGPMCVSWCSACRSKRQTVAASQRRHTYCGGRRCSDIAAANPDLRAWSHALLSAVRYGIDHKVLRCLFGVCDSWASFFHIHSRLLALGHPCLAEVLSSHALRQFFLELVCKGPELINFDVVEQNVFQEKKPQGATLARR